jgi:hypothetical protein
MSMTIVTIGALLVLAGWCSWQRSRFGEGGLAA